VPADNSDHAERQRLIDHTARSYRADGFRIWATVLCEEGPIIGRCGLIRRHVDDVVEVEVRYQIKSSTWDRSLATEAAAAIRDE
jgi:RimJ/RimL family protein N-acetyltransferase